MRGAACLVAASLLGMLAAQDRRPVLLQAQDAQGRPVVGAKVTCFASSAPGEDSDDVDVVEGIGDERGRVVCRLLTQRIYSAFAIVDVAAGEFFASEVCEGVCAGGEVVLRTTVEKRSQRVELAGAAAWQSVGPLRITASPVARNRLPLAVADGRLPKLPSLGCVVVSDAKGQPLWSETYLSNQPWRPAGELLPQLRDPVVVALPPPQELSVRVVAVDGSPVANAELWQPFEQSGASTGFRSGPLPSAAWRRLCSTGADGSAKVQIAMVPDGLSRTGTVMIEARAEGHGRGVGGVAYGQSFDRFGAARDVSAADFVLTITLPARQRLRIEPPGAFAVTVLGCAEPARLPRAGEEGPVFLRSDAGGVADLPLANGGKVVRVARLLRGTEPPFWSVVVADGADSVVSAAVQEIRVSVIDAIGNPARGRYLLVIPWVGEQPGIALRMVLDQVGRSSLRLAPGTWFVWCCNGFDAAWRVVEVAAEDASVALALRPIPRATVRFLDAAGKPRRAFRVRQWPSFDWDAKPGVENRFLIERQIELAAVGMEHSITDAEGCVQYLMLPLPEARLHFGGGGGAGLGERRPGGIEPGTRTDHVIE